MVKNQKSYTPEFKQQIMALYNARGTSYPQLESFHTEKGRNISSHLSGFKRSSLSNPPFGFRFYA